MKGLILPFAVLLLSFSTVSNAVSTTYDFAAEGNVDEAGYNVFDTKMHGNNSVGHRATNSPVPVPTAFWLFGTALIGFVGISRRTSLS